MTNKEIRQAIKEHLRDEPRSILPLLSDLKRELGAHPLDTNRVLIEMLEEGEIYQPTENKLEVTR